MTLLILNIIFVLSLNSDLGNIGRYEIKIETKTGEEIVANITIATYDKLKFEFKSDNEFKHFLFNIDGVKHLDSLKLYKKFHYINYPKYNSRSEHFTSVLTEDWITLSKSNIKNLKFKSLKLIDFNSLGTQLNIDEIKLLQTNPTFLNTYSIDAYQEGHTDLWILSYNKAIKSDELIQLVNRFKEKYESKTTKGSHNKNSWIYREMINKWQVDLKKEKLYLIEITGS